jgi:hypothetical protein
MESYSNGVKLAEVEGQTPRDVGKGGMGRRNFKVTCISGHPLSIVKLCVYIMRANLARSCQQVLSECAEERRCLSEKSFTSFV